VSNDPGTDAGRDPAGRVAEEVAMLLRLADRHRRSAEVEGTLERSAYLVLRILEHGGPTTITTIADRLRLDGSTVTRQVVAMEKAGLVVRGRDPHDGRATRVEPTERGRAELERTARSRADLYRTVLGDWSDDDRAALALTLERLNGAMDRHLARRAAERGPDPGAVEVSAES
jgi:DNA-binding MarR family transcriptional regulator